MTASDDVPWKYVDFTVSERMPSVVANECLWLIITFCCFVHAYTRKSPESRMIHYVLFFASILGGIANDIIFMYLPLVDNFWHTQTTIMLTARFPLYVLGIYCGILYIPTAYVWQLGLPRHLLPFFTAVLAIIFYAPFDIVGAKFLWWTWHDTDNNTIPRCVGVPVSSSMWISVFTCCFSFLLNSNLPSLSGISTRSCLSCLAVVVVGSVPLMMVHMMAVQILVGQALPPILPPPNFTMFFTTFTSYLLVSAVGITCGDTTNSKSASRVSFSPLLSALILCFHGTLCWIGLVLDPSNETSISVHQTYGPSNETSVDYSGLSRHVYISRENMQFKEYFEIEGDIAPYTSWYTIRGVGMDDAWQVKMLAVTTMSVSVFVLFPYVWRWVHAAINK